MWGRFLAAFYDAALCSTEHAGVAAWRAELLADVAGEVLEIGAGTGANLPFYPLDLKRLVLSEPSFYMRERMVGKLQRDAEVVDAGGQNLPFDAGSFDVVVVTLVLCTVPDPERTLAEIYRVLRPGGRLLYLEHVASEAPWTNRLQRLVEPPWKLVAGGCHLTRRTQEAMERAGFFIETRTEEHMAAPSIVSRTIRGVARKHPAQE